MTLTANEQYLIELVNRARLDPEAEADRYGLSDLNRGLSSGTISIEPKQVLAGDEALHRAAAGHSQWMLDTDTFSHTGAGGSSPGDRAAAEGYAGGVGENISARSVGSASEFDAAIDSHHRGLFLSDGHRANILHTSYTEIGVGQVGGLFTWPSGATLDTSMLTQNFGINQDAAAVFLTGVVYDDLDMDAFYSRGEGEGSVAVSISGGPSGGSAAAGGYDLSTVAGMHTVEIGNAVVKIDLSGGNGKLDLVDGDHVKSSVDLELVFGVGMATLLGAGDLDVTGSGAAEVLVGNRGDNELRGGPGNDMLLGGGGADYIEGNDGHDVIGGGLGSDTLHGQGGNDTLSGGGGIDHLFGGPGNDALGGGTGDDTLYGGIGDDRMSGGDGHDQLLGENGHDLLGGGAGDDTVNGGDGDDRLFGGPGNESLSGGEGDDRQFGASGNDLIGGGAGDDLIIGGIGSDTIGGGAGNDRIEAGAGDDIAAGGVGEDTLFGQVGNDHLVSGSDADVLVGGIGDDTLHGGAGPDRLNGGLGSDELFGASGADRFVFIAAASSPEIDTIHDWEDGIDLIEMLASHQSTLSIDNAGADATITYGPGGDNTVIVIGQDIQISDFMFV